MQNISTFDFSNKKALIRVDFNVPLDENLDVTDNTRIEAAIPTIKKVINGGGSVILMSHLGRPKNGPEERFSLKHIVGEIEKLLGSKVLFADNCIGAEAQKVSDNLKAIALRYFNPVGAHESGKIGELPIGVPQNLVPFITQTGIGLREQLSVFGDDYPTPDGTCIRDYIHVVDLAKAHVVALERLLQNKNKENCETFNLGTGTGSSVLEVIKSFEKVSGEKLNYKIVDRREGDIISAYADTNKANDELGWKTQLTLDDAMRSAWEWEKVVRSK